MAEQNEDGLRKHYIDNLRNMTILLLFPVHTFMVWNDFGSRFYVWAGESRILSTGIVLVNPWFMPILFVLAGMSARYALEKRTMLEFARQRIMKLGIPLLCGLVFLVPVQTLYARKYFFGFQSNRRGALPAHWKYFFTHVTDFSGYDGAFTPGHLWFILFLLVISLFSLILFRFLPYERLAKKVEKIPAGLILFLFVPIWLMYYAGNFGGFSLGKCTALYLLGYYLLSSDVVMDKIEANIKWLAVLCAAGTVISVMLYYNFSFYGDLWVNFIGWISILVFLAAGKKFLNQKTSFTEYFNQASYPVYILHQTILVAAAYYIVAVDTGIGVQAAGICAGSFILTVLAYHFMKMSLQVVSNLTKI